MQLSELTTLLNGTLLTQPTREITDLNFCGAADLMDEIRRQFAKGSVLVTGLTSGGVIQTAIDYKLQVVVMVRGKKPSPKELELAQAVGLPVLMTRHTLFTTCGLLYSNGIRGLDGTW